MFEKLDLKFKKKTFNKQKDISKVQTSEFDLPLVNAKNGDNGIMYYGRSSDFESAEMTIDIVNDGAVSTANVYPQLLKTGVLYNAYLIKPKFTPTRETLLFFTPCIYKAIKLKFSYENKASWNKVKNELISLPLKPTANTQTIKDIDFHFMEKFIAELEQCRLAELEAYLKATGLSNTTLSSDEENALNLFNGNNSMGGNTPCGLTWQSFKLGDLFEIVGTKSLDSNAIDFTDTGINFVGRTFSNNGIQGKTPPKAFKPNKPFTITATVIGQYKYVKFQTEPYYCSQNINKLTPKIIIHQWNAKIAYYFITHIQKFVSLYDGQQSGYKLDDIKNHIISLPTNQHGKIDFPFMRTFINALMKQTIQGVVQYSSAKIQATKEAISQEMPTQKDSLF
ncbi:restriction endonuclease subunit S [Helicobacter pylori]|uniref:restriction endonuclease subunit S n=1 Tax=Helicobacter pylori TaxID=210 RepID=UPI001FD53AEE|nr:restriction endonuclease subunit S [Helicobacter pylori]UOR32219.1 restriction endonuclease subunit S [Helicobacter pylori]